MVTDVWPVLKGFSYNRVGAILVRPESFILSPPYCTIRLSSK
jgi:hypothetical protein